MNDNRKAAWDKSVTSVMREALKGGPRACPLWMRLTIDRLYALVPQIVPYEPVCMIGMDWSDEVFANGHTVRVGLLLEKGWSVETSILTYRNFRLSHPTFRFDPVVFRTFSRRQLQEELGVTYGNIVADLCVDPDAQPVFGALLFGDLIQPTQRAYVAKEMAFSVSQQVAKELTASGRMASTVFLDLKGCSVKEVVDDGRPYSLDTAAQVYAKRTGFTLDPSINIDPRSFDHDLAAIRAEVRQAGCPVLPYSEESYESGL